MKRDPHGYFALAYSLTGFLVVGVLLTVLWRVIA